MVNSGEQASPGRTSSVGLPAVDASRAAHFSVAEMVTAAWRKSSWSAYNGGCVEVADLQHDRIGVRDTKAKGSGPILVFTHTEWRLFLSSVKRGDLDFS
jgi:Domain of unknown function (DUF397)